MGKQFLISAAIGAFVVGLCFSIIGAVTYDPSTYQYTPRDVPHGWEDPGNFVFAGMDGFFYGALIGAVLGGAAGAVTRAFSRSHALMISTSDHGKASSKNQPACLL
jgi:hypothetical protein